MRRKKTNFLFITIIFVLFFSSCIQNQHVSDKEIKTHMECIMECIVAEDADTLLSYFCADIQNNRAFATEKEIELFFDYIDGNIVSYKYHSGGGIETKENGIIELYICDPEFREVTTDTGHTYTIEICYAHIDLENPTQEGIYQLIVFENNDRSTKFVVGE